MVVARQDEQGRVYYEAEEFPLYYPGSEQFKVDGNASGARGAVAEVLIEVNNYPQIVYGVRVTNSVEVEQALIDAEPDLFTQIQDLHAQQKIRIDFAQQNITARPIHQLTLTGSRGENWHPLPVPYLLRGGNQVRLTLTRTAPYPTFMVGDIEFPLFPTAEVTLVCGVLVSDVYPAAGPPSSGALDERRRG